MYIINIKYVQPLTAVEKVLEAHRAFLDKYYASDDFVCSGPKKPRDGGIIFARTKTRSAIEKIISEDPFYKAKVAEYEIIEFNPLKHSIAFAKCL